MNETHELNYVLDGDQWSNPDDEVGKVKYVSDIVDLTRIKKDAFNVIISSCGTGKTHFVENKLIEYLGGEVKPREVMFVTSRSMIVAQSVTRGKVIKFNPYDVSKIREWNNERPINETLDDNEIITMTYDKLIYLLMYCGSTGHETLSEIKVIVFDECHTLVSDLYIQDINMLKIWIRCCLYANDKLIIGMTATPNIIREYAKFWGVNINPLNDTPLIRYKAKNLYCTQFEFLPYLFSGCGNHRGDPLIDQSLGKTILLCDTVDGCYDLNKKIPNSVVLISQNNKNFTEEMRAIRNHIIWYGKFPEEAMWKGKLIKPNVLLTTSTMREGINLIEESGVKNVVCCIPDEMNVTQFLGRCRFDVENLIVVNQYKPRDKFNNEYLKERRREFKEYIYNENDARWFDTIKHIVSDDVKQPERLFVDSKPFGKYIEKHWLNKCIYESLDKETIIVVAKACKLFPSIQKDRYTFIRIMDYIEKELKFSVVTERKIINGKRETCKTILKKES